MDKSVMYYDGLILIIGNKGKKNNLQFINYINWSSAIPLCDKFTYFYIDINNFQYKLYLYIIQYKV